MTAILGLLSIVLAIISAAYLQLPTFFLFLGYRWFRHYKQKRWLFRCLSLLVFAMFIYSNPLLWLAVTVTIFILFFLGFSLLNANPKVYIALNESQIIKSGSHSHNSDMEVLGYIDEQGHAVAYPLEELVKPRHLLNDTWQGKPLFVSYCMACRSAMVYNPVVNGLRLHFEVLGVYRRNMVMGDIETGTVWQQGTGEAITGRFKGQRLTYLPYQQMPLKEWLELYPESLLAKEAETVKDGIFSKDWLMKMMKVTEKLIAPGRTDLSGLPAREKVFGIEVGEWSKAYPISELQKTNGYIEDALGSEQIIIRYNAETNFVQAIRLSTGAQLPVQSHWWFGWKEFRPKTAVWKANK